MAEARPVDRAVAAYAVLAGLALAFPNRPGGWPLLVVAHALPPVLLLWPRRSGDATSAPPAGPAPPVARAGRILRDWYPLILLPALYLELQVLNVAVWGGDYFDAVVLGWEQALFGSQPSVTLAYRLHWLALSEPLHLAYLSYYGLIYLPPLALYLSGDREPFREMVFGMMVTFLVCYVVFIYFPVQGPRYLFPPPDGELARGPFYRLAHQILEGGSSRGSAFPSSHMAVATAQSLSAFRHLPRAAPVIALLTAGLGLGAVYGGFHYATDILAGLVVGLALGWAAPRIRRSRRRARA